MITVKQIKAARALLDWKQDDLARFSGISLSAINKFERGEVSARKFTIEILQKTFEKFGVEFSGESGLRLTDNIFNVRILEGKDARKELLDDIFETLMETENPENLVSGIDEKHWEDMGDYVDFHIKRIINNNIPIRVLLCEGDKKLLPYLDVEKVYRWIPKVLFTQMPYYVYGDKHAMIVWGEPMRIIIVQSSIIAETHRKQFNVNWNNGTIPTID